MAGQNPKRARAPLEMDSMVENIVISGNAAVDPHPADSLSYTPNDRYQEG